MNVIKVAIAGAAGRMGLANVKAITLAPQLQIISALDREGSPSLGKDIGNLAGLEPLGVLVTSDTQAAIETADVIIDFTTPETTISLAHVAAGKKIAHVIGTTGCTEDDEKALHAAANAGAIIVKSGNMSLGVNILASLVKRAAAALGEDFDAEVLEMHHNRKVDAPSGTALLLGEAVAEGRDINLAENAVRSRDGITGPREPGTIGFATLRGGNVVGDHSVMFIGPNERIEISHHAQDRALFANGAVRAAIWAAKQKPGYYSMTDVLGLTD